jgi:hypothetical protein
MITSCTGLLRAIQTQRYYLTRPGLSPAVVAGIQHKLASLEQALSDAVATPPVPEDWYPEDGFTYGT